MKSYGHKRYDKIECKYGCCTSNYGRKHDWRKVADRSRRKTARQEGKFDIFSSLINNP